MKLERLPEYLSIVVTVGLGIFLALYLGLSAGVGSNTTFLIIGGIAAVVVALILRENVWLLIPLCWPLTGQITGMPGAFPLRDLVMVYAFGIFLALKALKVVRTKTHYNWLDYLLFANLTYLFVIFIKNPVGTESMGSDRVGGKPYFEILFLLSGYWVIGHMTISGLYARKFPLLLICGSLFNGLVGLLTFHFPFFGMALGRVYTGIALDAAQMDPNSGASDEREGFLVGPGAGISKALFSLYPPLTVINPTYFWRFFLACLAVLMILKSGFRSVLISSAFFFVGCTYFRHGFWSIVRASLVVAPLVAVLVALQGTVVDLPDPMQRTLSFLPGAWNPAVVEDANHSVEWRHEIWDNVQTSGHKYINDWWFGDGFGVSRFQMQEMRNLSDAQENFAIMGDYHSLPLSGIRTVGYVGFSLYCVLLFATMGYSWNIIRQAQNTPFFAGALFVGVQAIVSPPQELLLTGFFDQNLQQTIFAIAMMRLISRSLEKYRIEQKELASEPQKELPELTFHRFQADLP